MKLPIILILSLLSGYVISQTCTGNCVPHGNGGCQIAPGAGTCIINAWGGCNRIWNSSGRQVFGPWGGGNSAQYWGFLSHTPVMNMTRAAITCP